jgi:hypothetical protein
MVGTPGKNARVALAAPTDDCRGDWDVVPHRVVESQAREFLADKYGAVDGAATTRGRLLVLRLLLLAGWPSLVVRFDAETLARTELSTWRTDAGNLDVLAEDGVA